jgi:hypothetical protein
LRADFLGWGSAQAAFKAAPKSVAVAEMRLLLDVRLLALPADAGCVRVVGFFEKYQNKYLDNGSWILDF